MTTTTTTKATKVIAALENGTEYLNKRVSSFDGQTYSKYRLGTAPRSVVAAGYRAIAQGV
mgnify:CR=1 FL=1